MIDWSSATGDMLSGIGTIIGAVTVFVAAWIGRATFAGWRRQKIEDRRIDLAEQILALAYQTEEAFRIIRFHSYDAIEADRADRNLRASGAVHDGTPIEAQSRLLSPQVTLDRLNEHRAVWAKLAETVPIARAVFGREFAEQLESLRLSKSQIASAAQGLAQLAHRYPGEERPERLEQMDRRRDEYEALIWESDPDEDVFSENVRRAIDEIDGSLGPIVRALHQRQLPARSRTRD